MAATVTTISLPALKIETLKITLIGDSPLIVHQWSQKTKAEMLAKQMKKANAGERKSKDPEQDFRDSLYVTPEGHFGFPLVGIKACAVTACTSIGGITKIAARQAFHLDGEYAVIQGEPVMREDMVRVGMGTADLRYRGEFKIWHTTIEVKFNRNVFSAEQVLNIFQTAGFAVGIGEWRPEKDGPFGRFHVASAEEMKALQNPPKPKQKKAA